MLGMALMNLGEFAVAERWCGQDPWELQALVDVVAKVVRPRLILEIGCDRGGSLFCWRSTGAAVIGVTLQETKQWLEDGHTYGAEMIYGNSHDADMGEIIRGQAGWRPIDFAFIDGDHSEQGCRQDLELCLSLRVPVIGFHDVLSVGDEGVRRVWAEACAAYPSMLISRPLERPIGAGIIWPG